MLTVLRKGGKVVTIPLEHWAVRGDHQLLEAIDLVGLTEETDGAKVPPN